MSARPSRTVDKSSCETETPLRHPSPLRYPGGKGKLSPFIKKLLENNDLTDGEYAEPYAGGASIALDLLLGDHVSRIHINDISRPIYAFWKSVLEETEPLSRLISDTAISVKTWDKQKKIFANAEDHDDLAVGFATFFLNRTNRSGILNGGIIGGRAQDGDWKIDARFNPSELIKRIQAIAKLKSKIELTKKDAKDFIKDKLGSLGKKTLIYFDPPYYVKGKALYYDFYVHEDHKTIAQLIKSKIKKQKWIVSYDDVPQVRNLYQGYKTRSYGLNYSARKVRKGAEVMFFCDGIEIPPIRKLIAG